jgi:hypothetical protein
MTWWPASACTTHASWAAGCRFVDDLVEACPRLQPPPRITWIVRNDQRADYDGLANRHSDKITVSHLLTLLLPTRSSTHPAPSRCTTVPGPPLMTLPESNDSCWVAFPARLTLSGQLRTKSNNGSCWLPRGDLLTNVFGMRATPCVLQFQQHRSCCHAFVNNAWMAAAQQPIHGGTAEGRRVVVAVPVCRAGGGHCCRPAAGLGR